MPSWGYLQGKGNDWRAGTGRTPGGDQCEGGQPAHSSRRERVWEEKHSGVGSAHTAGASPRCLDRNTSPSVQGPSLLSPVSGRLSAAQWLQATCGYVNVW